jgi:hypothetical protein
MAINGPNPLTGADSARVAGLSPAVERPAASQASAPAESQFTPTTDLTDLLGRLRQTPEVRQETIGEVARRLSAGELFIPPAPDRVVEELLGSNVLNDF